MEGKDVIFRKEADEKKGKKIHDVASFRGAQIPQFEADILQEIEKLTKKDFTKKDKIEWNSKMGFSVENQRVTGIGLYECGLTDYDLNLVFEAM